MPAGERSSPVPPWTWRRRLRQVCRIALILLGVVALVSETRRFLLTSPPYVIDALWAGLVAAAATAIGTLPVLFTRRPSQKVQDSLFGFGAGVMLAACAFSLIAPGVEVAVAQGFERWQAGALLGAGLLLGAGALLWLERTLPHEHFIKGVEGQPNDSLRRTWLFVFAIALHNLPEGVAIGVAFAGVETGQAAALASGIVIQDIPEGLVVALALVTAGYGRALSIGLGMASGLVEPLGAVVGATIVGYSAALLPWGLGFAAGAMLFVISHEIIPESHRKGHEVYATGGLMMGFVLMLVLDSALT